MSMHGHTTQCYKECVHGYSGVDFLLRLRGKVGIRTHHLPPPPHFKNYYFNTATKKTC